MKAMISRLSLLRAVFRSGLATNHLMCLALLFASAGALSNLSPLARDQLAGVSHDVIMFHLSIRAALTTLTAHPVIYLPCAVWLEAV